MSTGVRHRRHTSKIDIHDELLPKSIKTIKRDSSVSSGYRTIQNDYGSVSGKQALDSPTKQPISYQSRRRFYVLQKNRITTNVSAFPVVNQTLDVNNKQPSPYHEK